MFNIRKLFKFEMAHVVRNAWSKRCAHSIHGHSYVAEIFLSGEDLDNAGMVLDFGLMKKFLHPFIDSFDHATWLWLDDDPEIIDLFTKKFDRVILSPFTSSAEQQAEMFAIFAHDVVVTLHQYPEFAKKILPEKEIEQLNKLIVSKAIVHETTTGYAEFNLKRQSRLNLNKLWFSEEIRREWPAEFRDFYNLMYPHNPVAEHQTLEDYIFVHKSGLKS